MKKFTNFENLIYFTGATAVLLALLILALFSIEFDFWGMLFFSVMLTGFDVFYFIAYRKEKHATVTQ